jgi:protocatechuate 3,4-dioxygenase beta subunit
VTQQDDPETPMPSMPLPLDDDDKPIGRVLTRREVLALFGAAAGAGVLAACSPGSLVGGTAGPSSAAATPAGASAVAASGSTALPACVVRPALTEGPFFVDEMLQRSDIRSDPGDGSVRPGVPLALTFMVSHVQGASCTPLVGALVDVWHCDASGVYSDVAGAEGKKFLRGYQLTDANGAAKFATIYPGWYQGRAVHIHFKIRTAANADSAHEFTSQLFFDDSLSDAVFAKAPYNAKGQPTTRNADDGIFGDSGGQLTLAATPSGDGYAATFEIGVQIG